jgi:hypothetical protein
MNHFLKLTCAARRDAESPAPSAISWHILGVDCRCLGRLQDESRHLRDIEMISPNRSNCEQKTQDGRPLHRYRNFFGFVQLACLLMLLRHL